VPSEAVDRPQLYGPSASWRTEAARPLAIDNRGTLSIGVCCRDLYGQDRMLIAWPANDQAIVVLVGRHDGPRADVYGQLLLALAITALDEERDKPPCCDEGDPPTDDDVASDIAEAVERWARTHRRAR